MRNTRINIFVLVLFWVFCAGAGVYVTFLRQPEALDSITTAEKMLAVERSELHELLQLEGKMNQEIQYAAQRWKARYKNVDDSLTTADVVDYVNRFANRGLTELHIEYAGNHFGPNHRYYAFNLRGSGPFEDLYDFVWHMENNRDLYRIENLVIEQAGANAPNDVTFGFKLLAYYGASNAISASETAGAGPLTSVGASIGTEYMPASATHIDSSHLPLVPDHVLPARRLQLDPFRYAGAKPEPTPSGMKAPSPRPSGHYSILSASLTSIVGNVAIFSRAGEFTRIEVGDLVDEGEVIEVDARLRRVSVRSASGNVSQIEMEMPDPLYRQSMGSALILPIG